MREMIVIILGAVLVENFVLVQFLGICPFLGVSKKALNSPWYEWSSYFCNDNRCGCYMDFKSVCFLCCMGWNIYRL